MEAVQDYRKIDPKVATDGTFPASIDMEYRIYFTEAAHEAMQKHADTTTEVEIMGILVGEVKRDAVGPFLLINATIEGKDTNNQGTQVTLTHQAWNHINSTMDKQYPKSRIVGWYHTHPGFGIFLSKMDLFIQDSYFNHPFQIAVVLETKKNQIGCFTWMAGKSVPIQRYWAGSREVKLTTGVVEEIQDSPRGMAPLSAAPGSDESNYRGAGGSGEGPSFSMILLLGILFFAMGLFMGRSMVGNDMRESLVRSLEAETLSIFQYASLSTLASKDFSEIQERTTAAADAVNRRDGDAAAKILKDMNAQIEILAKTYQKPRQSFREDLVRLQNTKQTITDKQDALENVVTFLLLSRIVDQIQQDGKPIDLDKLSPFAQNNLRKQIEITIRLNPSAKEALLSIQPKIFDFLYGEKKDSSEKKDGEGKKDKPDQK